MTRLNTLDTKVSGSDAFGLTNYNKLKTNLDYLSIAGADLASAATINPTAEFHGVTGTTTIDNITDTLGAVAGQQVRLWVKGGPLTIRHQGGGTGNIRNASGVDRVCAQNDIVAFVYDGTVWREAAQGSALAYAQDSSGGISITATTEATANTIVTAPSVTLDGGTPILVEFYAARVSKGTSFTQLYVYDNGSSIGILGRIDGTGPVKAAMPLTPSAGAHIYSIRASVDAGSGFINTGAGGAGAFPPAFIRVTRR